MGVFFWSCDYGKYKSDKCVIRLDFHFSSLFRISSSGVVMRMFVNYEFYETFIIHSPPPQKKGRDDHLLLQYIGPYIPP